MAIIRNILSGAPAPDFAVSGSTITVKGLEIDCAAHYAAGVKMIEVRGDANGNAVLGGDGPFIAVIEIPGLRFLDGEDVPVMVPLDPNAVTITLWPAA